MNLPNEIVALLEQLPQPVFLVQNNTVAYVNRNAKARNISESTNLLDLIKHNQQEYQQFQSGKLILTLSVDDINYNTVVTNFYEYHMFCLESPGRNPDFTPLGTAAVVLRDSLSKMHFSIDALLPNGALQDDPKALEQLRAIKKNIYQLHRNIRNMSDVSSEMTSKIEHRNVVKILEAVIKKANALLCKAPQPIEFVPLAKQVFCLVNTEQLERAMLNLILNAVKYGIPGQPIKIAMRTGIGKVYISIENECAAAQELFNSNIFSAYSRAPSIQDGTKGIGLGLTIVHNAAAAHKGALLLEQIDNSLRFTISLSTDVPEVCKVKSPLICIDNSGGFDNYLIELSEILPEDAFE